MGPPEGEHLNLHSNSTSSRFRPDKTFMVQSLLTLGTCTAASNARFAVWLNASSGVRGPRPLFRFRPHTQALAACAASGVMFSPR